MPKPIGNYHLADCDCDICCPDTAGDAAPVETRLTAEQFVDNWIKEHSYHEWMCGNTNLSARDAAKIAEAFRDESESQEILDLREENAQLVRDWYKLWTEECDKVTGLREEIESLRATNRELNRRCQALTHTINTNSDRKTWYGYYQAALSILGWEEEKFKTAAAGLREENERLNELLPDSLNRPMSERVQGLLERANREANLAVEFREEIERLKRERNRYRDSLRTHSDFRERAETELTELRAKLAEQERAK